MINGILLPKLFWPTLRKNCSSDQEKFFWNSRLKAKFFEITRTIYSNSERSEQFLVTECFFNLFLEVSQIKKIRTIIFKIGKNYWNLEICRKSLKNLKILPGVIGRVGHIEWRPVWIHSHYSNTDCRPLIFLVSENRIGNLIKSFDLKIKGENICDWYFFIARIIEPFSYSRVYISSDKAIFKILKKPFIVEYNQWFNIACLKSLVDLQACICKRSQAAKKTSG